MSFINFYEMCLLGNNNQITPLEEYGALPWCHASALGL